MRKHIIIITVMIFIMIISGCSQKPATTPVDDQIPFTFTDNNGKSPSSWNKALRLKSFPNEPIDLKIGTVIDLEIDNISDNKVKLPYDRNIRIFDMTNGMKELNNRVTYIPDDPGTVLAPMKSKVGWLASVSFAPSIKANTEIKIRVFIIGEMLFDDPAKNEPIGAYMDLVLHP